MGSVTASLAEEAREIFRDLGYDVTDFGSEFTAERKWRTVRVTTAAPSEAPDTGPLRCFVTRDNRAPAVREELLSMKPDYDWAVVGVDENGSYRVYHPSADVLSAP